MPEYSLWCEGSSEKPNRIIWDDESKCLLIDKNAYDSDVSMQTTVSFDDQDESIGNTKPNKKRTMLGTSSAVCKTEYRWTKSAKSSNRRCWMHYQIDHL